MRDCVYRANPFTPANSAMPQTPVQHLPKHRFLPQTPWKQVRLFKSEPTPAKTPKREVVELERSGKKKWMIDKEALILKDWVKSHLAMKRYMRHPEMRRDLEFKEPSDIEHQNMFNFLSRKYVWNYKDAYEERLNLFLKGKPLPEYCLTQSPGTCVLFSILNLYLVNPGIFQEHLPFVQGLCAALHPFPVATPTLTPPETKHMLSDEQYTALETIMKKEIKIVEVRQRLVREQFTRQSPTKQEDEDSGKWREFEKEFAAFVAAYANKHDKQSWKDGEENLDTLNFTVAVNVLLPDFSIHTIQPVTSHEINVSEIFKFMTLAEFLNTVNGKAGCVLVQSDVELLDKDGKRMKVTDDEVRQAREDQIRQSTSTEAASRHAFMYHRTGRGSLHVYDSWDGTISTWGRGNKWNGLGSPQTWIVYAYAQ